MTLRLSLLLLEHAGRQISKLDVLGIKVGNSIVRPSDTVRNLGVWFDSSLNMETHISKVCKSAFYML